MRTNYLKTPFFAALFFFALCTAARADSLFRLFPEIQLAGVYSDNIPLRTTGKVSDFLGLGVAGFYLDYTSEARYASLHYDTFAQLFARQSRFDRAGEGQYVSLTDAENISPTTKLHLDEVFYRDSPTAATVIASGEGPQFNNVAAQLLLASFQVAINDFNVGLTHAWGRNWSSDLIVHQETVWGSGSNSGNGTSYAQSIETSTTYHLSGRLGLLAGYRFYDFRFTAPGFPGEQAHWPYVGISWQPLERLYFQGIVGVVFSHIQGQSGESVNPAGRALLEYTYKHAHFNASGGQVPELIGGQSGAAELRYGRGGITYDFTPRLTGNAGAGYNQFISPSFNGEFISWGGGLSDRVNKWLVVYARFIQVRQMETASSQFLPSGVQSGREAIGNYLSFGFNASVEAFRWSWQ